MKTKTILLIGIIGFCALLATAQTYRITTNLLSTDILSLGTNTIPTVTNRFDSTLYHTTTWACSFRGSNSDTSGILRLYFLHAYDSAGTNILNITNEVFTLPVNGNNWVSLATNFGEDHFSFWAFDRYELSGTCILTNFNLCPIQKGYLIDR